ncbi:metallophosphoesterase [Natrialba swarupiae]|nr:metallophosphoesterase [Natrialba swarupiae]
MRVSEELGIVPWGVTPDSRRRSERSIEGLILLSTTRCDMTARIGVIPDIHMRSAHRSDIRDLLESTVSHLRRFDPDLVVALGDVIEEKTSGPTSNTSNSSPKRSRSTVLSDFSPVTTTPRRSHDRLGGVRQRTVGNPADRRRNWSS